MIVSLKPFGAVERARCLVPMQSTVWRRIGCGRVRHALVLKSTLSKHACELMPVFLIGLMMEEIGLRRKLKSSR
jgi:hypothetical protein